MIYRQLLSDLKRSGNFEILSASGGTFSYLEFAAMAENLAATLGQYSGEKVALYFQDSPLLVSLFFALDKLGCDVFLFGSENAPAFIQCAMDELGITICLTDQKELCSEPRFVWVEETTKDSIASAQATPNDSGCGQVVIFTSGTSGKPKGALHNWESLAAGIKIDERFCESRWLLTYGLTRFAGLQVFLQAFLNNGCLVLCNNSRPSDMLQTIMTERVEYLSGTPTFWRKLLATAPPEQLSAALLKQITLGGEIVSQGILNALRSSFPQAQITHIYASTEMGVCFAVRDGMEGFPVSYLQQNPDVQMEIRNGELYIRSKRAMKTYLAAHAEDHTGWFATGDLVEARNDRVYFLGRKSEIINVGGSKVYPAEVEEQIRLVPGVQDLRVFGVKSSFAGNLVSAEIVALPETDKEALKQAIQDRCNSTLPSHKRPRFIQFVDQLKETASKKIKRK
ncbi:MAG: class I adenylate-forming enzyme family protein [Verrucomicrobiales bacterium]